MAYVTGSPVYAVADGQPVAYASLDGAELWQVTSGSPASLLMLNSAPALLELFTVLSSGPSAITLQSVGNVRNMISWPVSLAPGCRVRYDWSLSISGNHYSRTTGSPTSTVAIDFIENARDQAPARSVDVVLAKAASHFAVLTNTNTGARVLTISNFTVTPPP